MGENSNKVIAGKKLEAGDQSCPLRFDKLSLCAQLIPKQDQIREKIENRYILKFWKQSKNHNSVYGPFCDPGCVVTAQIWMKMASFTHQGIGSVIVEPQKDEKNNLIPGVYELKNVTFSMRGDWEIHIILQNDLATQKVHVD